MIKSLCVIFLINAAINNSSCMRAAAKQQLTTKFEVSGSIMQTASYCGGAQPTQKILDSFKTPKPIPFGKLIVLAGAENKENAEIIDTIQGDASGNFSISLSAGEYCLVEEWKSKPFELPLDNKNEKVDAACFRKLYNTCDYTLSITNKNIDDVKVTFHKPCFFNKPCVRYSGPLPPRARQQ